MWNRLRREWWWFWNVDQTWPERLSASLRRFWLCRVRGQHRVKFATAPRCYRCGKVVQ